MARSSQPNPGDRVEDEKPFDFLGARPIATVESVRQIIEAENVLASYSHSIDLLAEAIQNALDAIDARSEMDPDAPRRLVVEFDAHHRRFVVTDTGVGLSRAELGMVLTPNVTLKQGGLARPRSGRSRGEKGVGLTFLVLASDDFQLRTCDGEARWDLTVTDAGRWVRTGGDVPAPKAHPKRHEPDEFLGSDHYTSVSIGGIPADQFDDDLFERGADELVWELRTRTAIGNTAVLFEPLGRPQPKPVEIELHFRGKDGKRRRPIRVPYAYATPEDLLRQQDPEARVYDFEELKDLDPEQIERRTRGAAMRYVKRTFTASRGPVDLYLFTMDGNELGARLNSLREAGQWVPDEWQGMYVATRDMPTGIRLPSGAIADRTYERRMFILLQYDELKLDLGRKTLAGRTPGMLSEKVAETWREVRFVVMRLAETASRRGVSSAALRARIRRARALPDLNAELPYLKEPDKPAAVLAVFHEMLARNGVVPALRTLSSGVFRGSDSLMFRPGDDPDKDAPLHVLFALRPTQLIDELENQERLGTVALGVVWTLEDAALEETKVTVAEVEPDNDGATHELQLHGLGRREGLRIIVLDQLLHSR